MVGLIFIITIVFFFWSIWWSIESGKATWVIIAVVMVFIELTYGIKVSIKQREQFESKCVAQNGAVVNIRKGKSSEYLCIQKNSIINVE